MNTLQVPHEWVVALGPADAVVAAGWAATSTHLDDYDPDGTVRQRLVDNGWFTVDGQPTVVLGNLGATRAAVRGGHTGDAVALAALIARHVHLTTGTEPKHGTRWTGVCEQLIRLECAGDADRARRYICWVHADPFWASNILSPSTARTQYQRIQARARRDPAAAADQIAAGARDLGVHIDPHTPVEPAGYLDGLTVRRSDTQVA